MDESHTRQQLIDIKLADAGWNVNDLTQVITEFDISVEKPVEVADINLPYLGHQFSDYVLLGKDGKPMAVVEAKRTSKDAKIGREQAKQYCYNIQKERNCELPFCFYTNGLEIYFWDLENYPPRKVVGFPTRDDLERYQFIRSNKSKLANELINTKIAGRDYQLRAIRAVLEGIERKRRDFLLVMATGTGKTRTCIALVDTLMRSRRVERVLFLVDRISLREQALDAFKEYLPDEPRWPKVAEKIIAKDRRIYISTYPGMLNIIRDPKNKLSPHFFDLVVIDESHRSIYNTYGEILDYFKALNIGLTATPTDVIDHNTFELFECEDGLPSFAYTYEEAVNNVPPYLSDFQVMKIQTRFQLDGISKRTISLEDQKKLILEGKDVEDINFEGTQLEKQVINKGTNTLIVKEFMEESIKDHNGVLPGKTIFFCSTIQHARRLEEIFDQLYPQYNGELAKVLVSDDPRVYGKNGLLAQFTNSNMPRIAISVDMLDTGVDVREIVNLVFAKPIYSYTKFWQMIGRGTRLLEPEKIKPWCTEKDVFLILDCWDNFEYFKLKPKGKELKASLPLPVRYFGFRIDKIEKAHNYSDDVILQNELQKLRQMLSLLPENSVTIIEAASKLHKVKDDNFWNSVDAEKLAFLRNEIKPLFRTVSQTDFKAMRFEKDVLEVSLALLGKKFGNKEDKTIYETLSAGLVEQISQLPLSIPMVNLKRDLIEKSQQSNFWKKCTDSDLYELSEELAPLMKFRDCAGEITDPVILNLQDSVKNKDFVEFGPENEAISVSKYQEMVEQLILNLTETNPVLKKIQSGSEISENEAAELAEVLNEEHPHITEELLQKVYKNRQARFLQFIKHILGIEILKSFPDSVAEAFEQFYKEHSNLNSNQMNFLKLLKDFIIEREKIEKRDLIQSPFTLIHPQGIRGVFSPKEIDEILALTGKLAG